jgi:hypothetical protein
LGGVGLSGGCFVHGCLWEMIGGGGYTLLYSFIKTRGKQLHNPIEDAGDRTWWYG